VRTFFDLIEDYATEVTGQGNPKNQGLVANIADLRLSVLHELWQETEPFPDPNEVRWWEVWLTRPQSQHRDERKRNQNSRRPGPGRVLREVAAGMGWGLVDSMLTLPDNVVALVQASATELSTILTTNAIPSELHRVRATPEILDGTDQDIRNHLIEDLLNRVNEPHRDAPAVCILDTGIMGGHRLLKPGVNFALSALGDGRPGDENGHGTKMAGLALYGDLEKALTGTEPVLLRHRIESVKVLHGGQGLANKPEMYPTITSDATASAELERRGLRAYSMAVTTTDDPNGSDGRPTSYSVAIDALAFGTDIARDDDGIQLLGEPNPVDARLFVVSAGNIRPGDYEVNHLDLSDLSRVENPAQAWNALTVGAHTELTALPNDDLHQGYSALAAEGELSPFSRTSVNWTGGWPIKPDVVLEGGNLVVSQSGTGIFTDDALCLLTTSKSDLSPLGPVNATSAAAAQASRLAALVWDRYPSLWPETVRSLIVHAAEWTPAMRDQFKMAGNSKTKRTALLRRYGWGVPTEERVLSSAASSVTMMVQDSFFPFEKAKGGGIATRVFRLHQLPWPQEQLEALYDVQVRLRVTLSYFVEPNPSSRGWEGRYRYASHRLRFDVKLPTENVDDFERRLSNEASQEETSQTRSKTKGTDSRWYIGPKGRNAGSLNADIWTGTGAELAEAGFIGVIPVGGWWKDNARRDRLKLPVRYALLVSLQTDAVEADIYTPIAAQIGIPVEISG
jgi:hypothetical protein